MPVDGDVGDAGEPETRRNQFSGLLMVALLGETSWGGRSSPVVLVTSVEGRRRECAQDEILKLARDERVSPMLSSRPSPALAVLGGVRPISQTPSNGEEEVNLESRVRNLTAGGSSSRSLKGADAAPAASP